DGDARKRGVALIDDDASDPSGRLSENETRCEDEQAERERATPRTHTGPPRPLDVHSTPFESREGLVGILSPGRTPNKARPLMVSARGSRSDRWQVLRNGRDHRRPVALLHLAEDLVF